MLTYIVHDVIGVVHGLMRHKLIYSEIFNKSDLKFHSMFLFRRKLDRKSTHRTTFLYAILQTLNPLKHSGNHM
jgi:hypothetical protein